MPKHVKSSPESAGRKLSSELRAKPSTASREVSVEPRPPKKADSGFAAKRPATLPAEAGVRLAHTASPDSLWGSSPDRRAARAEIMALPPEQRAAKLEALKAEKGQVEEEIGAKVDVLWKRLTQRHMKFRSDVLKSFTQNPNMSAEVKAQLQSLIAGSDAVQVKLDALKARAGAMPKTGTPENAAERSALAKEIMGLRKEQGALIHAAEKLMTDSGLKVDLLVDAEKVIAPETKPATSLKSLVLNWLGLGSLVRFFEDIFTTARKQDEKTKTERVEDDKKTEQHLQRRMKEQLSKELDHRSKMLA
ncbi:MAG: hypothetical protein ACYC8T_17890 [Myxococcaceae bacterium]